LGEIVEKVEITLQYEVRDVDALFEAAKAALEKLRAETVAEYGESDDRLYAQSMEQVIKSELYEPGNGELHLSSCITAILDSLIYNVPGTELRGTTSASTG